MLPSDYQLVLAVLTVAIGFVYLVHRIRKFRQWVAIIDKIPGPAGVPILGVSYRFFTTRENVSKQGHAMTVPYSKSKCQMIRTWFGPIPLVTIIKAESAKILLESNKEIAKSNVYEFLHKWLGIGLLTSTGAKWHQRRKLITPTFHFNILDKFLVEMNKQANILVQILDKKCQQTKNQAFDVYPYVAKCTLDIICETAMGKSVNAQLDGDNKYVAAINDLSLVNNLRVLWPWLAVNFIFRLSPQGWMERRAIKIVHQFTNEIIKERRKEMLNNGEVKCESEQNGVFGAKRRVALLDMLLETSMSAGGPNLTDEDIREEVDTFMFEGHDTTSTGIGWALYCIGQYPNIQDKIVEELNQVLGEDSHDPSREELHNLKYLDCVIKESMRMYPPVPMFGRELQEDMDICGDKVPRGVQILVSPYWVHRDEAHYPNPDEFDPDRFLPENCKNRHPFAYVPFSAGPRNCVGQRFALLEMKAVLSQIVKRFRLTTVVDPELEIVHIFELVLRPLRGIFIQMQPRHK